MDPSLQNLIDNFALLPDWSERYRYLIELGETLPPLSDQEKSSSNKVSGCASQVWMVMERVSTQTGTHIHIRADSDAHIVRGLLAILIQIFSGKSPAEIQALAPDSLFEQIGLLSHLSSQRTNGLRAMIARIKQEGLG